ncbi:putative U-box domain-containing protein 42 isoform X2 [Macadamia integrifolia]|uniref:putative U-box domain-containing protein 42 isoform X2 n=1 Tax=Macadamia integrifolia TaxID=60698 RepID=UPI001C4F8B5A|nr:putative U-box domain-containing protein 42 isoform X2 [Macadamia integrifolia]
MSLVEDKEPVIVHARSLVQSISEITSSLVCIDREQENFMEIGSYLERTSPVIMELQTNSSYATEILQAISKNIDLAKNLVGKCLKGADSIPDMEFRSILQNLEGVIKNIGLGLSLIPFSAFRNQEYAEVAVQSLSREMKNVHIEINHVQASDPKETLQISPLEHLLDEEVENDLYSVQVNFPAENLQSTDMPLSIDFVREGRYIDHGKSSTCSLQAFPKVAKYKEPQYASFLCPLTGKIMDDPVTIESGATYERWAITEWFKKFEDGSADVICPATGRKLAVRTLNTNVALRTTIEEWKERNEATRIKVVRDTLSVARPDSVIFEALRYLQHLCKKKQYNKVEVRNIGMIPLLARFLKHKDENIRCATVEILQSLAEEDDESKEMIAKTDAISRTIKMLSSNHLPERHASLSLLLELSRSEQLYEVIGSVTGCILMLIMMKYNHYSDAFTAKQADEILKNLENSPKNIKCMAENGHLEPLLKHLIEEEMQLEMGSYLGEIVLGQDTKTFVAERASPALIKMIHSGKSLTRRAAFKALVKMSSYHPNSSILVKAGVVPNIIEEMFTPRIYNEPMSFLGESATILANILESGPALENLQVNRNGHTMESDYVVYTIVHMLKSSAPDEINVNLIRILLSLTKSPKAKSTLVSVVKESEASYTLIELIDSPHEELGITSIKLLISLAPYMGYTLSDRLCKTRGQPENLIKNPSEIERITEKHAVSANFLAKLPHLNLALNLSLFRKNTVPIILKAINDIQSGERMGKFSISYLEGLVGVLVRLTTAVCDPQILSLARDHNLTSVFTELLMTTSSDEVQRLSATGLENLSAESINLSKQPPAPPNKGPNLKKLQNFLSLSSSKGKRLQMCPIHKGPCSSQTTFCLLEAKAVKRLLACLEHENVAVVKAALSAICTLLDEKVDVDNSVTILSEMDAIKHVLKVLRKHKQEVWQKSLWVIEKFLMKGGDSFASEISEDRSLLSVLVSALHHGDIVTRRMAEKILKHLNRLPDFSTAEFLS